MSNEDTFFPAEDSESHVDSGGIENARFAARTLEQENLEHKHGRGWFSDDDLDEDEAKVREKAPVRMDSPPLRQPVKRGLAPISVSHPQLKIATALATHQNALVQCALGHASEHPELYQAAMSAASVAAKELSELLEIDSLEAYVKASRNHMSAVLTGEENKLADEVTKESDLLIAAASNISSSVVESLAELHSENSAMWSVLDKQGSASMEFEKLAIASVAKAIQIGMELDFRVSQEPLGAGTYSFSQQTVNDERHTHHFTIHSEAFLSSLRSIWSIVKSQQQLSELESILSGPGDGRATLVKQLDTGFKNKFILIAPSNAAFDTKIGTEVLLALRKNDKSAVDFVDRHLSDSKESLKKSLERKPVVFTMKSGRVSFKIEKKQGRYTLTGLSSTGKKQYTLPVVELIAARNGSIIVVDTALRADNDIYQPIPLPPEPSYSPTNLPPPLATQTAVPVVKNHDNDDDDDIHQDFRAAVESKSKVVAPVAVSIAAPAISITTLSSKGQEDESKDTRPKPVPKFTPSFGDPKFPFKTPAAIPKFPVSEPKPSVPKSNAAISSAADDIDFLLAQVIGKK